LQPALNGVDLKLPELVNRQSGSFHSGVLESFRKIHPGLNDFQRALEQSRRRSATKITKYEKEPTKTPVSSS
jgi:hypothetical protein